MIIVTHFISTYKWQMLGNHLICINSFNHCNLENNPFIGVAGLKQYSGHKLIIFMILDSNLTGTETALNFPTRSTFNLTSEFYSVHV